MALLLATLGAFCISLLLCKGRKVSTEPLAPGRRVTVRFVDEDKNVIGKREFRANDKIFMASARMKRDVERIEREGKGAVEAECRPEVFRMAARMLDGKPLDRASAEDMMVLLLLLDYLDISRDCEAKCYRLVARNTVETQEDWGEFAKTIQEEFDGKRLRSLQIYTLRCGDAQRHEDRRRQGAQHVQATPEVLSLVQTVAEVMDIRRVDVRMLE
ncbi:UNVERIFIED_CONTAM: hypothetical protein PYX00_011644 [Menopon gallinae]|uniref:Uncharacterized protein n=1 Tax=Menopon gallinae TaxID=328185 RepID=A0AAW2H8B8_9NEOP